MAINRDRRRQLHCGGIFYARSITPIYEATGSLRLDPSRAQSLGLNGIGAGALSSQVTDQLGTEIAIIQSDAVAVGTLNMLSDEEFRRFSGAPRSQLVFSAEAVKLTPQQVALLTSMKDHLKAAQQGTTQMIDVSFRGPDPQLAATIVNDAIAAYLKQSFDSRTGSVDQVKTWLGKQLSDLRNESIAAQSKLTQFQEQNNILVTGAGTNSTLDSLKTISQSLTEARAKRIVSEAQLRAATSGDPQVIAAIFPSSTMTALLTERAAAQNTVTQLSSKFDENWPPLIEARRTLLAVNQQFDGEVALIRNRVKQDYNTALSTEQLLQAQYDQQLDRAYALNRQEAAYGVLLSESKTSRDLYDELERSLQQAGITAGLNAINTMPVDRARAPLTPVEPRKTVILGFGFMIGLFVGLASAFLRELINDTVKSEEQVQHALRSHILAVVPHLNTIGRGQGSAERNMVADAPRASTTLVTYNAPLSRAAEAYRNIRNSLLLSGQNYKTLLVTSSIGAEGKSSTISNLAVVLVQNGARVLLVDADLRRPRLHTIFGLDNLHGLSNMILGEDTGGSPVRQPLSTLPNLHVLTAGRRLALPAEALGSPRLYDLLQGFEQQFDYVLIDSAPLLIVSDSLSLCTWADAMFLVVRYNISPTAGLRRLRSLFLHTQPNLLGVIFNDLPVKSTSYGGYGYGSGNGYYE